MSFENLKITEDLIKIDLSKAFDTVDHKILLSKLNKYGIKGNNLMWFTNYLSNRKQFIEFDDHGIKRQTDLMNIRCGVPQGSILGPLLFIIYINDLCNASKILEPIMFADDTNLFCSDKHLKTLFQKANKELGEISKWFQANRLSLNENKTKFTLFHKPWERDNIPLKLPSLKLNHFEITRTTSIKFLGVMIDENLNWTDHIHILENKLSKNIGLLYRAKQYLDEKAMTTLYFSFFHSYLTYGNIAWASTFKTNLAKLACQQRRAVKAIPITNIDTGSKSRQIMEKVGILNIHIQN